MLGGIGGVELIVIFMVILIFFGANKIPELARGIGQGMNEFKKASNNIKNEIEKGKKDIYDAAPKKDQLSSQDKKQAVEDKQEKSTKTN